MSIKIAVVGAGSIGFTRKLMKDILSVPELRDTTFAFTDISKPNLDMITQLGRRDIKSNGLKAKIQATLNRRNAIEGADFVVNTTRIGGLEAFQQDVEIPLKYGIDQCVGDTLCAGGIMYGQRNIPVILNFCKDIRELAAPNCMLLNYANPNAMNTWAANQYGEVYTLGLCHGVQHGHRQIAEVIELLINEGKSPEDDGYVPVTLQEVDIICAGINHQTWYTQIRYRGMDWTDRMAEGFAKHPVFRKTEKVRIDMLNRFGYYTTESNGHVSEYVAWYRKRPRELKQWRLKHAMLMDPLTSAVCMPNEISQMTDEMLIAQAQWLQQYAGEIPAAKSRFSSEKRLGTRSTRGAARLKTKSVDDMRKNVEAARENAAAADKALAGREALLKN
ncbi:MAG: hypothetical protein JJU05_04235 [Verrucomicrobia bacterium]|nr:hypothetical protein [Verrucomicrobiota bacterium]MCH8525540.1 hypothetical protein [Kiritimatiellia bacterium]